MIVDGGRRFPLLRAARKHSMGTGIRIPWRAPVFGSTGVHQGFIVLLIADAFWQVGKGLRLQAQVGLILAAYFRPVG